MDAQSVGIGDVVEFVDPERNTHNALIIAVHPYGEEPPSLNLVYVSDDPNAEDSYGRQIAERPTSVVHKTRQAAQGFFWRVPGSE